MKRIMMLKPRECASGDFTKGKIYDVLEDKLCVYEPFIDEEGNKDENIVEYEYNEENLEKFAEHKKARWVSVQDNSSQDDFEVFEGDDRFIIFENDNELAHTLIDRIEGLDSTIVNMALYFK